MRSLASFIMRGRMQAVLIAVLFAGLSLILPPLVYLSGGAIALVTLRMGLQQGLSVAVIATLVMSLLATLGLGNPIPGLVFAGLVWLPVWFLSMILRQSVSLSYMLGVACGVGLFLTLAGFVILGDPTAWWQQALQGMFSPVVEQAGLESQADFGKAMVQAAKVMTGIFAIAMILNVLFGLMVGRWWQAMLYNPGGFREEFHQLRLPKLIAWLAAIVFVVSLIPAMGLGLLAGNLMIVLVFFFLLQGLAVCHAVVANRSLHMGWLIGLYVLMVIAMPQMTALLALIGFVDCWLDIRVRFAKPQNAQHDEQDGSN